MTDAITSSVAEGIERGSYESRIVGIYELASYLDGAEPSLANQARALIAQQLATWEDLALAHQELSAQGITTVPLANSEIIVQPNPRRMLNTKDVSPAAIAARPCFLDASELAPQQRGVSYDSLVLLANPYPVLADHLVVVDREHVGQSLGRMVRPALALSQDLAGEFFVFYNGVDAGASAPDHAHLQAGTGKLPIEKDIEAAGLGEPVHVDSELEISLPEGLGRSVVVIRGTDGERLAGAITDVVDRFPISGEHGQPLTNVIFTHRGDHWVVYAFARQAHRPPHFYAAGDEQIMVSPSSLEMTGILIVPRIEDVPKITPQRVTEIYQAVSVPTNDIRKLLTL